VAAFPLGIALAGRLPFMDDWFDLCLLDDLVELNSRYTGFGDLCIASQTGSRSLADSTSSDGRRHWWFLESGRRDPDVKFQFRDTSSKSPMPRGERTES